MDLAGVCDRDLEYLVEGARERQVVRDGGGGRDVGNVQRGFGAVGAFSKAGAAGDAADGRGVPWRLERLLLRALVQEMDECKGPRLTGAARGHDVHAVDLSEWGKRLE